MILLQSPTMALENGQVHFLVAGDQCLNTESVSTITLTMTQLTLGNVVDSGNHVDRANTPPSVCGDVRAREVGCVTEKSISMLTGMKRHSATPE